MSGENTQIDEAAAAAEAAETEALKQAREAADDAAAAAAAAEVDEPAGRLEDAGASVRDRMAAELEAERAEARGEEPAAEVEEEVEEEPKAETPVEEVVEEETDPLEEFITTGEDGQRLFVLKVDGKNVGVPLEQARSELQQGVAGAQRLAQVARDRAALTQEREEFEASKTPASGAETAEEEVNDESLREKVKEFTSTLTTGTDEEIGDKLLDLLKNNRGTNPKGAILDETELVEKVAPLVRKELEADSVQNDAKAGMIQFKKDFPEIASDRVLFDIADKFASKIEAETPGLKPSEVQRQAGEQVRAWQEEKFGKRVGEEPSPSPKTDNDKDTRAQRKEQLKEPPPSTSSQARMEPSPSQTRDDENVEYIQSLNRLRGIAA